MLNEIPLVEYLSPTNIDELTETLRSLGDKAKIIAGGSDLLGLLKDNVTGPQFPTPEVLVSINKIPELKILDYDPGVGLTIGAAVTLTGLDESTLIREKFPVIAQAARSVATLQIRNVGTIGGNLCQRPWCWYFRHPLFPCFKKGGKQCYAITGEHKYYFSTMGLGTCVMSHPSDLAPALVALDASLTICGPNGVRKHIPIRQFFNGPKEVLDNILRNDEVLVNITIPKESEDFFGVYEKDRLRDTWDLSLASAAVLLKNSSDGKCSEARIVLGGLAPYPFRARIAEALLIEKKIDESAAAIAAEKEMEKAKPLSQTKYKVELGRTILKRAILSAAAIPEARYHL